MMGLFSLLYYGNTLLVVSGVAIRKLNQELLTNQFCITQNECFFTKVFFD